MKIKYNQNPHFVEYFDSKTGVYIRSGIVEKDEKGSLIDTGVDPFMSNYPRLIDVGIMGNCIHGMNGLCIKSGVQCYQDGLNEIMPNMKLDDFKKIVEESSGECFQFALGGRGDANKHENFKEIVEFCSENDIVPNYTTSGLELTDEEVNITKKFCGAVAVSWYRQEHTLKAIKMFVDAGVKTNIHYVLGNNSIDEAIERLENNDFPKGINAVVFLLHKPVGLGKENNVLSTNDSRVKRFFKLVDGKEYDFKIGFDSCTVPGLLNFTKELNRVQFDTCEAGRWSMYITSDMKAIPCSFDNQDLKYAVDLNSKTIKEAWDSEEFNLIRNHFHNSCSKCIDRVECYGGCPLQKSIVLCNRDEKDI